MRNVLGYYIYRVALADRVRFYNACIEYGVELDWQSETEEWLSVRIPILRARYFEGVMEQTQIPCEKSSLKGILGVARRVALHPGVMVGMLLSLFLYIWLGGMVWEVRVSSPTDIDEDTVLSHLSACGLAEGVRISKIDPDTVSAAYLLRDTSVAFMTVHLNGVVAEVEILPKDEEKTEEHQAPPCNIVASRSALITDVTVYRGKSLVKVGDTVAEGDVLVSGIITDQGGTRLLGAVADVRGLVEDTIQLEIPLAVEQKQVRQGEIKGVQLSFFGLSFGMGETGEEYIKEQKQMYLFGIIRLPIHLVTYRETHTTTSTIFYTGEEAEHMAQAQLKQQLGVMVGDGTLITYETQTACDDKTFVLECHVEYESNIAKALAFEVGN